jgi:SAM-dependent methyltransferase
VPNATTSPTAACPTGAPPLLAPYDALALSAAVAAARRTGVLHRLVRAAAAAPTVAADCGLDAGMAEALLVALTTIGLTTKSPGGQYAVELGSAVVLNRLLDMWDGLEQTLLTGEPRTSVASPGVAGPIYADLASFVGGFGSPDPRAVAFFAAPGRTVLDIGAGMAKWSRALVAAEPTMRATVLDLPPVVDLAVHAVVQDALGDRFDFVSGDLFTTDPGGPFDLAVIASVCHLFDSVDVRRLLDRALHWLVPGGEILIAQPRPARDVEGAVYQLGLRLRTTGGGLHPFSSYAAWLIDTGFEHVELLEANPPMNIIRARRAH